MVVLPQPIRGESFSADVQLLGRSLKLRLVGVADTDQSEKIGSLLRQALVLGQEKKVEKATVDFTKLEFMNSSCFKMFVTWVSGVNEASHRHEIRFLMAPSQPWQRRSLTALRCFAISLVTLEEG